MWILGWKRLIDTDFFPLFSFAYCAKVLFLSPIEFDIITKLGKCSSFLNYSQFGVSCRRVRIHQFFNQVQDKKCKILSWMKPSLLIGWIRYASISGRVIWTDYHMGCVTLERPAAWEQLGFWRCVAIWPIRSQYHHFPNLKMYLVYISLDPDPSTRCHKFKIAYSETIYSQLLYGIKYVWAQTEIMYRINKTKSGLKYFSSMFSIQIFTSYI